MGLGRNNPICTPERDLSWYPIEVVHWTSSLMCAGIFTILSGKKRWARVAVPLDVPTNIRKVAIQISIVFQ